MDPLWLGPVACVGLLLALPGVAWLVGRSLPAAHVAQGEVTIPASRRAVAERIRDAEAYPLWRRGLVRVGLLSRSPLSMRYREHTASGSIAFELSERIPSVLFECAITDEMLPYGGRWFIRLETRGSNETRVHIREEGVIRNPLLRAAATYVLGYDATLRAYLEDLLESFPPRQTHVLMPTG